MSNTPHIHQLKSGMNVVHYPVPGSPVTHCALMIKAGARDEPINKTGIAHFIEHIFFKGTQKRKAFHILNSLEVIGGELNAYTTKEETCIHASVMNNYLERATELIADILYNSTFPVKEMEKEKQVIIDEIHAYEDMPYEQIFEDFEGLVFNQHPLGNSILGSEKHIHSFTHQDVLNFIKKTYNEKNMVWVVAGSIEESAVIKLAEKYFSGKKFTGGVNRLKPSSQKKNTILNQRPNSQFHFITGQRAYSLSHENRFPLILINNILGGPGMNSRLSLNIREKYGFTYSIESGYHALSDTGLFHVYFATEKTHFEKTKKLMYQEFDKMVEEKISERRFQQHKQQLIGQITMAQENKLNIMLTMAKNVFYFDRIFTLKEITEKINDISIAKFKKVTAEMLDKDKMSSLVYEPVE